MAVQLKNFEQFSFSNELNRAILELNYTKPTPIQQETIPYLLSGEDVIGQAQTGTGKTAAFALPLLTAIDSNLKEPQALILAPTRELAIQICKAIESFSKYQKNIKVAAIYGGDGYSNQIRMLRDGAQIIVSTPGRMMDHMRRNTVNFASITKVVLDEADEMLRMGFIEDVEWILEQLPNRDHTALFSATMPKPIKKIALKYLKNPKEVIIKSNDKQTSNIKQKFIVSPNKNKFNKLTRILEAEDTNSVIIFARTKSLTEEIADKLIKLNFKAAALNGDMAQALRKKTIDKVKNNNINILVATDVAARGIDIESITHVINYDAPHNIETYIHRIGRTARAGRSGMAILFLTPNETRMLRDIEVNLKCYIEEMPILSNKELNAIKLQKFKERVLSMLNNLNNTDEESVENKSLQREKLIFQEMLQELQREHNLDSLDIATALVMLKHQAKPILVQSNNECISEENTRDDARSNYNNRDKKDKKRARNRFDNNRSKSNNTRRNPTRDKNTNRDPNRDPRKSSSRPIVKSGAKSNDRRQSRKFS